MAVFKEIKIRAAMSYKASAGKCAAVHIVSSMLKLAAWLIVITAQFLCVQSFGFDFLYGWQAMIFYLLYIFIYIFLNLPINMGTEVFYSAVATGNADNIDDVFMFYKHDFSKSVFAQTGRVFTKLVLGLITIIVASVVYFLCMPTPVLTIILVAIVFLIIIAVCIFANIKYSAIAYMINKNPQLSTDKTVKKAVRFIKGSRMSIFGFILSMLLWHLLGIISLGIGYIWIAPYLSISLKKYYMGLERGF